MLQDKLSELLPELYGFKNLITKEKSVFHTMNMFKVSVSDYYSDSCLLVFTHELCSWQVVKKMGSAGESKTAGGGVVLRGEGWVVKSVKEELAKIVRGR